MSLMDLIKRDIQNITGSSNDFGTALEFTSPGEEPVTVTINGLATRHNTQVDTSGNVVNTRNVHCSFAEALLTAEDYPVRTDGEIMLEQHKVAWTDATGVKKTYIIEDCQPDETVGLLVCRLGEYTE